MTPLGKEIAGDILTALSDVEVAELLRKLLLIKNNIRLATGRRGTAGSVQNRQRQGHP